MRAEPLITVRNLSKLYPARHRFLRRGTDLVRAVDGVSFDVFPGETLALVGESGCGKTTTGRSLLRLIEPTEGDIQFGGVDVRALDAAPLRKLRRHMQIVFQDPYSSLDPRMTVGRIIREGIDVHDLSHGAEANARVGRLLEEVGLRDTDATRYPHEFSGGQRQRIAIARALAVEPKFIVLDEAVSALDVTVQAQVLALLIALQRDRGLTYLFISHNLAVVENVATRVAVMYLGRIVEVATVAELYSSPTHPYTQALLSAIPVPDPRVRQRRIALLPGDMPVTPHSRGCVFYPRCPHPAKDDKCLQSMPQLEPVTAHHSAACIKNRMMPARD